MNVSATHVVRTVLNDHGSALSCPRDSIMRTDCAILRAQKKIQRSALQKNQTHIVMVDPV